MEGAREAAERLGYDTEVEIAPVVGEAREAGADLAGRLRGRVGCSHRPRCLISSGETTVTVSGSGRGGRNQELALSAALALAGVGPFALLSAGTDGIDGPTDAAGAIVDHTTLDRARLRGGEAAAQALRDNNSHGFFEPLGDLILTGPTDTNVGDLQVCLTGPAAAGDNGQ
jgi:glycerate-2-kinase